MADTKKVSKKENIKTLYQQLEAKTVFIQMAADDFGLEPTYLRTHWFSSFWAVPKSKQDRLIELLQNTIRVQNEKKSA